MKTSKTRKNLYAVRFVRDDNPKTRSWFYKDVQTAKTAFEALSQNSHMKSISLEKWFDAMSRWDTLRSFYKVDEEVR